MPIALINLYESPILREITGPLIRPGGFELTERGLASCGLDQGDRVLDVGCGAGAVTAHLRSRHDLAAFGIDPSDALIAEGAQTHPGLPLARGRAEQLPWADGCFDAVLCECALSLCSDPDAALREMGRILRPGGHLVLTDIYNCLQGKGAWAPGAAVRSCLQGAVDGPSAQHRIRTAGLELIIWEDHSPLLRQLAARMVWEYGSLDAFWSAVGEPGTAAAMQSNEKAPCCRPGYYLAVAQKPEVERLKWPVGEDKTHG